MNTTIRNLIAALPLAAAAVTMTPALAMADGPVIVLPEPGPVDPEGPGEIAQPEVDPEPHPQPGPQGPGDIAQPDEDPEVPDDKDGPDHDEPVDHGGPDGITNPDPCPTHGGGPACTPDDEPTEPTEPTEPKIEVQSGGGLHPKHEVTPVVIPTRVDAGLAPATEDDGLNLAWTLAGGALVTASGAAFAARRVRSKA